MRPENKPSGCDDQAQSINNEPEIRIIKINEIEPVVPDSGGTVIILQRNAEDERSNPGTFGAILPKQAEAAKRIAQEYFDTIFTELGPEEARKLVVMVLAGDTTLTMETGQRSEHKRAVETAQLVIDGILASFEKNGIGRSQFLNAQKEETAAKPFEVTELIDLKMMEESPEFVQFLVNKYGTGKDFWVAYEKDLERDTRKRMGVEGPSDIAERINHFMGILAQTAREYHKSNPDRRLVIWAISHYDSISPFVKAYIAKLEGDEFFNAYCPVDYLAGITIKIDKQNNTTTKLGDKTVELNLSE